MNIIKKIFGIQDKNSQSEFPTFNFSQKDKKTIEDTFQFDVRQSSNKTTRPIFEIISFLKHNSKEYGINLFPGASDRLINKFESTLQTKLPEDLKTFYYFHNGFESEKEMFRIIPLNEILENKDNYETGNFIIAEYCIFCDTWEIEIDHKSNNGYILMNASTENYKNVLTNSFACFLAAFLKGGVCGHDGIYDWQNETRDNLITK